MPNTPPPLYLDEDVSRGFDVMTARDATQLSRSDIEQLEFAAAADRILFSHNRIDFERLHGLWLAANRAHAGIIIARRRLPRELAARLGRLLTRLPPEDLKNQAPRRIQLVALTLPVASRKVEGRVSDGA